ncbi:Uu.00g075140.m01.CDS01 [Anthostomella pinea]|uniref:Uu.00g075140.m01.CDS01 n=1 Tax=Anthostomella pinea TaxID=933095 RepID=A0AAI8VVL7_9PEZI|nr:Uu.00g075140.m01.CDS01 [Anthostomella pinea]
MLFPKAHELVIRNAAFAINPADYIKQVKGNMVFPWVKYPFVLGSDVAGEVVEVGSAVTRFRAGDRVVAYAASTDPGRNSNAKGGFQLYSLVCDNMAAPVPEGMALESAAVLPMGVTTASCALFGKDFLKLRRPGVAGAGAGPDKKTGSKEVVLVWGGSTSVGCNAIQLAVAAGYDVVTTCSPRNFNLVKSLGATQAFDYRSPTVVADIVAATAKRQVAGALAIGSLSGSKCMDVVARSQGKKFVAMVSYPVPDDPDAGTLTSAFCFVRGTASLMLKSQLTGVKQKFVFGSAIIHDDVGKALWEDFLPAALQEGRYVAAPEPQVVGHDLECLQANMDLLKRGVSAKKFVVTL